MKKAKVQLKTQTLDFIGPEGEEDEDDLEVGRDQAFYEVVLGAADWTTETILSQLNQGNILLNPDFQRREAWDPARQSRFIESLFLGLPIPQLFLAEARKKKGKYFVIDGKQRLLTLQRFAGFEAPKIAPLKLRGLKFKPELNGKTYPEIKADPILGSEVARFENQTIRAVVLKNWQDEAYIHLVFLRLNTESVKLSPQELRLALHPGEFMKFAMERSEKSGPLLRTLRLDAPDFRMRDVELFIRYFAFKYFLPEYQGNLKAFLDKACEELNKRWETEEDDIRRSADGLENAIEFTFDVFSQNAFRKWDGARYEERFNRAIFDVMVYHFSTSKIRDAAGAKKAAIERGFKTMCERSPEFVKSVETTTKSISATRDRLTLWTQALSKALGISVRQPVVAANR